MAYASERPMLRRYLVALVSLAALAFAIMPVGAAAAPLDASSVYIAMRGFGGPPTPPDANGDAFGSMGDDGSISGALNGLPPSSVMRFQFDYVLHTRTGIVEGTGAAFCYSCSVAGLIGSLSFTVTASGHGSLVSGVTLDGGTWKITGATGALVGIAGAGNWTEAFPRRFLTGSILFPGCDTTGDGNGDDQCKTIG